MDLTESITPKSDQLNADDLMAGPRTVTIVEVLKGSAEQPVNVVTEEYGPTRPYKPSKSMRRVMVSAWGIDTVNYAGRRLTLFRNPTIRFGKDEVGGIQISHLSHIDKVLTLALTVSRGHRAPFVVEPLDPAKDVSGRDWLVELADTQGDVDAINTLGKAAKTAHASEKLLAVIRSAYQNAKSEQIVAPAKALDPADPSYVAPVQP